MNQKFTSPLIEAKAKPYIVIFDKHKRLDELKTSSSKNYSSFERTSTSESFPELMENGIIIKYELVKFLSEIV